MLPDGILGSPGLGYVREWILRNTRILASIDLHPDTFQPDVSIQTSVLVLQRKSDDVIAVETAAGRINPNVTIPRDPCADSTGHHRTERPENVDPPRHDL